MTFINLHKSYGQTHVLKGIDFTVQEGEVVAIIGPSGSGKTTLLRSLNSLDIPDKGELTVGEAAIQFERYHKKRSFKTKAAIFHGISALSLVSK
ncbi:amino acid ABC transporter ATP-binding protein [Bacillus safensis FO-36b] [Bacillus safensis subsp. safensis]